MNEKIGCNTVTHALGKETSVTVGVGGYKPYGFYIPTPNHLGTKEVFVKCPKKMKEKSHKYKCYNYNWTNHYSAILGRLIASFQSRKADP